MINLENPLYSKIVTLLELARKQVATTVNLTMVHTYFEIGRTIIEDEQQGESRAEYGKQVMKELSIKLKERFGKGFSVDNLQNMRKFFLSFSKYETPSSISQNNQNQLLDKNLKPYNTHPLFKLSWSHYLVLMRIENPAERNFYEIEAAEQNWSLAQLNR
jgi:predicted nuclease of restriction endonuclease-like (RecB) superfamily